MSAVFTIGRLRGIDLPTSPALILSRLQIDYCSHSRRGHFVAFLLAALDTSRQNGDVSPTPDSETLLKTGEG